MTQYVFADNATSTLASGISGGATSLVLNTGDGAKFPAPTGVQVFTLRLGADTSNEVVTCTARSTDTVTCSATANAWPSGTPVILTLPKLVMDSLVQRYEIAPPGLTNQVIYNSEGSFGASPDLVLAFPSVTPGAEQTILTQTAGLGSLTTNVYGGDETGTSFIATGGLAFSSDAVVQFSTAIGDALSLGGGILASGSGPCSFSSLGGLDFADSFDGSTLSAITLSGYYRTSGSNVPGGSVVLKGGQSKGNAGSVIELWTAKAGASGTGNRAPAVRMTLTGDRLGINTTTPAGTLDVKGAGTSTGVTLQTQGSGGAVGLQVLDNGSVGFFGTAAVAKQTVSGSRATGAALVSLLSALAAYGFITDSTTT